MQAHHLVAQLSSDNVHKRREAAAMLSWQPDPIAYDALVSLVLNDADVLVRQHAIRALGELRTPKALRAILQQLDASDDAINLMAAQTLATVMSDDLIAVLSSPEATLAQRTVAAWALGHCGNYPHVWAALRDASQSTEASIREMAQSSLEHLQRSQPNVAPRTPSRRRATS